VLGSDGLFDQVKAEEMGAVLSGRERGLSRGDGCQILAEMACSRWLGYADDISCVVIYL
jgi:serine/threonine protein phosphatase PrpC